MSVTVNLEGFLMGADTAYEVKPEGIGGLIGSASMRTNDVSRGHDDGVVAGYDYYDARLVTIPVTVLGDDAADCLDKVAALRIAWSRVDDLSLLTLVIGLWGQEYTLEGRPREVTEDSVANLKSGKVELTCEFLAPDPHILGPS